MKITFVYNCRESVLREEFSRYGHVADVYIPMNLHARQPRNFAFMRFIDPAIAERAINEMDGRMINGMQITVEDSQQGVFFSQDTGHITNYSLGAKHADLIPFDSSMPKEHYNALREAQIDKTAMHSIRVNNVENDTTDDKLRMFFGPFGTIGDIKRPIDLKTRKFRDFVFIRYLRVKDAIQAAKEMNHVRIDSRIVTTEYIKPVTYFGQDETSVSPMCSGIC